MTEFLWLAMAFCLGGACGCWIIERRAAAFVRAVRFEEYRKGLMAGRAAAVVEFALWRTATRKKNGGAK